MSLPGQYRATPQVLADGQPSLLGVDVNGNLVLSAVVVGDVAVKPPSVVGDVADIVLAANAVTPCAGAPTPCATAILIAPVTNADDVRFGSAGIGAARGAILKPGQSVSFAIDDLAKLKVWSATAGVKVAISYNAP